MVLKEVRVNIEPAVIKMILGSDHVLSKKILSDIDLQKGMFFSAVSENVSKEKYNNIYNGGWVIGEVEDFNEDQKNWEKGEPTLKRTSIDWLTTRMLGLLHTKPLCNDRRIIILGNTSHEKTDAGLFSLFRRIEVIDNDPLVLLSEEDVSFDSLKKALVRMEAPYVDILGIVSETPITSSSSETINTWTKNVVTFVIGGVYDSESYLVWVSEPYLDEWNRGVLFG